ncbi:MAG TPA: hydrogenase maturation nickel metallochaperone HypA [Stellaceae bacterium]|nr:hydrogenase maturation nickel metallochaperone HypA [Stellaceae bacterium]
MHELAVCQALIATVENIARRREARVKGVRVAIGPLSGIEPHLLAAAYPLACAGTSAEGSLLAVERSELRVRCRSCGAESPVEPNRLLCGACGDWRTDVVSGDEMMLLRVELEVPETALEAHHV